MRPGERPPQPSGPVLKTDFVQPRRVRVNQGTRAGGYMQLPPHPLVIECPRQPEPARDGLHERVTAVFVMIAESLRVDVTLVIGLF
jgi:hypothetical protein